VSVLAAVPGAELPYHDADLRRPVAVLLGAEGSGLPPAVAARASRSVSIPMAPGVESLNVAVTAGVILFEAARQRRTP
jgi:tRNA G18 (ribose-2'-O)-methylase SpoU